MRAVDNRHGERIVTSTLLGRYKRVPMYRRLTNENSSRGVS